MKKASSHAASKRKPRTGAATARKKRRNRDIVKDYPRAQFIAKVRRLADALERGERFTIQVAGHRIRVPGDARINIEHEVADGEEELEFQIVWKHSD